MTDFHKDHVNQIYWFTFTTMATAYDGWHPVAGNRRFGITSRPGGGYTFYIAGVDRAWDRYGDLANQFDDVVFSGADDLWMNIQNNVRLFINNNQGTANFTNPPNFRARVDWDTVKDFLLGNIDLQTLKNQLGCN